MLVAVSFFASCKKKAAEEENQPSIAEPRLIFKFKFDSTQIRLNNFGGVSNLPSNHRAQSPRMNKMSAHYIELAQNDLTALGAGKILFHAPETTLGGSSAIDFNQSVRVGDGQEFFSIPLKNIGAGVYKWLRVSLAYQNYDIVFKDANIPGNHLATGTIASFVGYNTYITNYTIKNQSQTVNANKLQGYWGFETQILGQTFIQTGQAAATTVVNPNFQNSPIPAGSCVVTAQFVKPGGLPSQLVILGNEKQDIVVTVSLSVNNSFEWLETNNDNYFEPSAGDQVVDMGIRGMIPYSQ
jgi:hypothetical protein